MPPPPWIVGHRGAAGEACENTLSAFRRGREAGADMLELDVQLAADGVPVCFHDRSLKRLASRPEIVEQQASSALADVRLGQADDRLPTLGAALADLPVTMPLNIELKRYQASRSALAHAALDALDGRSQVLISSFDWTLLESVRDLAPDLPIAPLSAPREIRARVVDPTGDLIAAGEALCAFSLHCSRSMVERSLVELARTRGFEYLLSYTVNDPDEAERFFGLGVAGIFTDVPSRIAARLRGSTDPPGGRGQAR